MIEMNPEMGSCYLNDLAFRLRFLRCESFDARKASLRFVRYLEFCTDIFGSFVGERPIRFVDLVSHHNCKNNDERKTLLNSRIQYLPFRDRSGRRVCVQVGLCGKDLPVKERYKILTWMHLMAASKDTESQQKGVVMVVWPFPEGRVTEKFLENAIDADYNRTFDIDQDYHRRSFDSLPVRIASIHFCSNDSALCTGLSSAFYFGLPNDLKTRYVLHHGIGDAAKNEIELADGKRGRRRRLYRVLDVLFKAGRNYGRHLGNSFLLDGIIEGAFVHYSKLKTREEKGDFMWKVTNTLQHCNTRFLEWNRADSMWIRIRDPRIMREKVAQSFRVHSRRQASKSFSRKRSLSPNNMDTAIPMAIFRMIEPLRPNNDRVVITDTEPNEIKLRKGAASDPSSSLRLTLSPGKWTR